MRLDPDQCRRLAAGARFAVLATRAAGGSADLVPITFALDTGPDGDRLLSAVDHKPKSSLRLARLANIERAPEVTLLFDHRDDDWDTLWWVRARGPATVRPPGSATGLLAARYPQYVEHPPQGPVIEVRITAWSGWSASA
jgi:PPOX class probable F420-dependent enzyme